LEDRRRGGQWAIRRWYEERGNWRHATGVKPPPSDGLTFEDEDFKRSLRELSLEQLRVIGVRAALRAVPLMSFGTTSDPAFLAAFLRMLRIVSLTWTAAAYPDETRNLVPLNAARTDAINTPLGIVRAAAGAVAAFSANPFESIVEEVILGVDALRSASSQSDGVAAGVAFALAQEADLRDLRRALTRSADLARNVLLWPGGSAPEWTDRRWETLKRDLMQDGQHWKVWVDWYEDRVPGGTRSEPHQFAYVEVPGELWTKNDAASVNAWITRRFDRMAGHVGSELESDETIDIPQVPNAGPGPRFQSSPQGPIERVPASEIDETGNNIGTINQLKPMVLQCASELKVRLSRNEFPELAAALERYEAALNPGKQQNIQWGEVWGLGIILQNAASAAERQIAGRLLPALEDPAKTALDSLLSLHGPLILASKEGAELSAAAQTFAMTRDEQAEFREASEQVAEQLRSHREVASPQAAGIVVDAVGAIGEGKHPERGSVYALATVKNITIVLIGGAAIATPTLIGALLGSPMVGTLVGAPFSILVSEVVKKSPAFSVLVTQLGAHLEAMTDADLQGWLDERSRRLAPFRSFVISNEEPLRKIAASTSELKWMLRYIDFIVAKK
jgi:hypothetical protein